MIVLRIALLSVVLVAIRTGAVEPASAAAAASAAGEAARQAMREAMMKQAATPLKPVVLPTTKPDDRGPQPERPPPGKARSDAAHQRALPPGLRSADAMRAAMANRAAWGGAWSTTWQMSGDKMDASMMQRCQGMDPGTGGPWSQGGNSGWGMGPNGWGPGTGPGGWGPGMGGHMWSTGGVTVPGPGPSPAAGGAAGQPRGGK